MTLGVVIMVHTALDRAGQAIRLWTDADLPVCVHVDHYVDDKDYDALTKRFADCPDVLFAPRRHCDWGDWSLVQVAQEASQLLLDHDPKLNHIYLASGACLPLRPIPSLKHYLDEHPDTDFIESSITSDVPWTVGGLDHERFTMSFPFSWKRQRGLFDQYVRLQRALGFKRRIPKGIVVHMGSQWWCLTRKTLEAILNDPMRPTYDKYFRRVWIPDESYFQTLVRRHSDQIESRSLTLSQFDYQGKPHIFYDDHKELLAASHCFVARKIWPGAEGLYSYFPHAEDDHTVLPDPSVVDQEFAKAKLRRTVGRAGLQMQSSYRGNHHTIDVTARPYSVLHGFSELFENFESWLSKTTGADVHGHLFAPDKAHFAGDVPVYTGSLSDDAALRDYNPRMFLTNLIWNRAEQHQCFQFGPNDTQEISWTIAQDPNARVMVISGAWIVPLFLSGQDLGQIKQRVDTLQHIEQEHLKILRSAHTHARIRVYSLANFAKNPMVPLQIAADEMFEHGMPPLKEVPKMVDLRGLGAFLQELRNEGVNPFLTGEFPVDTADDPPASAPTKRYMVR